jgi:excisionase family DNA binding protein
VDDQGADYYTTGEAARVLGLTESRIRQMLLASELEGERDPTTERWRIPQHAVHARLETRRPRERSGPSLSAAEWLERVEVLQRELGRLEGRLQLTEQTDSTLRETLERERQRADRLEEQLSAEREKLEAERSKGFWSRLFGG